jgi:hypothetical protein
VRAQQKRSPSSLRIEEEGVVHVAGRMAFGEVERGEVELIGFDVRPFGDRKAHIAENGGDLVDHLRYSGGCGLRRSADKNRLCYIQRLGGKAGIERGIFQRCLARVDRVGQFYLEPIERRTHHLALFRRHLAEGLHLLGHRAFLAQGANTHSLKRGFILG